MTAMYRLVIICLILNTLAANAQTSIQNISLTNPNLNILYIGIDNIIDVEGLDTNKTYKVISANGQISK